MMNPNIKPPLTEMFSPGFGTPQGRCPWRVNSWSVPSAPGWSDQPPNPLDWFWFLPWPGGTAGFGRCSYLRGEVKEAKLGQAGHGKQEMGTVGMGASLWDRAWDVAES